jgi:hypothetical protein
MALTVTEDRAAITSMVDMATAAVWAAAVAEAWLAE